MLNIEDLRTIELMAVFILAVGIVAVGVYPAPALDLMSASVKQFSTVFTNHY
jgi:NADH:ubiquinone oxidoreductase subunit 4 (subunit M)